MSTDYIYDIETYPNVFTLTVQHAVLPMTWQFVVSPWRNDASSIVEFMTTLARDGARMVGFNNIGFDYPILHLFLRTNGTATPDVLYRKAQAIIAAQESDRWSHEVRHSDRIVDQIDLYRIHHFDNQARATSLKVIEFNLRRRRVMDLPFPVGSVLTESDVPVLLAYNEEDTATTKEFYFVTLEMIRFREELTTRYNRDFMNHNDTKIGKDYFVMALEAAGVSCHDYHPETGRTPRQTRRPVLRLTDALLPWIEFRRPEFQRIHAFLKEQTITETKGVFKNLTATVDGFEFVFGTGGIHGSVENRRVDSDDCHVIVDLDVSSYYPNLAIKNRFYPEHLGPMFCDVYQTLYDQRKQYPKGTAENAMLKLALNGVYGDSNNRFSVFYDPLFTMKITLNGQLLLCLLAEQLMKISSLEVIQINTDGVTVRLSREKIGDLWGACLWWEELTGLSLERTEYQRMHVLDVNNYLAVGCDGKVKRKGRFEHDLEWHQNHGALVVPKVAEEVLVKGAMIRESVVNWIDVMDFMMRTKVPRSSYLSMETNGVEQQIPNVSRYYVSKDGGRLFKWMPPLENSTEWRRIGVCAGWNVTVCNDLPERYPPIDYDFYIREVEKLCLSVM